jgi:hypothetical protein
LIRAPLDCKWTMSTFEAAEVLAGAYRGKDIEERALLIHTVEVENWSIVRVLCRSVKLENLITDAGDVNREPTCPKCKERFDRIRAKMAKTGGAK